MFRQLWPRKAWNFLHVLAWIGCYNTHYQLWVLTFTSDLFVHGDSCQVPLWIQRLAKLITKTEQQQHCHPHSSRAKGRIRLTPPWGQSILQWFKKITQSLVSQGFLNSTSRWSTGYWCKTYKSLWLSCTSASPALKTRWQIICESTETVSQAQYPNKSNGRETLLGFLGWGHSSRRVGAGKRLMS